jgi:hypothetical protein
MMGCVKRLQDSSHGANKTSVSLAVRPLISTDLAGDIRLLKRGEIVGTDVIDEGGYDETSSHRSD